MKLKVCLVVFALVILCATLTFSIEIGFKGIGVGVNLRSPAQGFEGSRNADAMFPRVIIGNSVSRSGASIASSIPGDRWIRIEALGNNSVWSRGSYTPQQILSMIQVLKPNFLDRFVYYQQNPAAILPGGMPAIQFMQEALNAMPSGGTFSPYVSACNYNPADPTSFLKTTQSLLNLNLTPKLYVLSVDNWEWRINGVKTNGMPCGASPLTETQAETLINSLHAQGWKMVQVTECGKFLAWGLGDYTETCVNIGYNWNASPKLLSVLHQYYSQIELYMDTPSPMNVYCNLNGSQQAQIAKNIAGNQSALGVTYVWPILQENTYCSGNLYDANQVLLNNNETMFAYYNALMNKYNPS